MEVNLPRRERPDRARDPRERRHRDRHAAALVRGARRPPLEARIQRARKGVCMNIGIDLGTTNSALAYIDPKQAEDADFPPIHIQPVPQHTTAEQIEPLRVLALVPVHQRQPGLHRAPTRASKARWCPTKSVHSAKSWLSNADVDRTAKILPWDSPEGGRIFSPVEVSARYLQHMREAWDNQQGVPLDEQDVVLTVPASFDEEARELTVQAANEAGITNLTLLEEPAAAFYSWIANHLSQSQKSLHDGQMVLVCDVGGGTSDFTLIRVNREGDQVEFTRTAVGKHLLLGGDNLDLTLAWLVEAKLGTSLSLRQRSALRRQCASAKERLLADAKLEKVDITVLGAGTGLVGGTLAHRDHPRGGARTGARRLPAVLQPRGQAQGREAVAVPRTRAAVRFGPGRHAPPRGLPDHRRRRSRRHPVQRRLLHPRDPPQPRRRRHGALVRQAAAGLRKPGSRPRGLGGRGLLLLRALDRRRAAGARRPAACLLHRRGRGSRHLPRPARHRGRLDAERRPRRPAARRQQAGILPPVQLADPHRGHARTRW